MSDGSKSKQVERPPIAKHDIKLLDLAFAMDCTGSMGSYIDSARDNIRKIVEEIVASEKSDVRLALVEYRDHPPQESSFVTRVHDFTPSPGTMKKWLEECSADGGGDTPEAVADALHDMLKLSWRDEATKICVCVSDAPPHGLDSCGDGFPNGCPAGIDPMVVANQLAEKGVTLYVAGCEPSLGPYKDFFMAIAYITGGQYVPLTQAQVLTRIIVGGAQEEMSLEQFMAEVDEEVQAEVAAGRDIDEAEITRMVHGKMKSKGIRTKQLRMNNAELASATDSPLATKFSKMKVMSEVRKDYEASGKGSGGGGGMGGFDGMSPRMLCSPMMATSCPMPAMPAMCPMPGGAAPPPPPMAAMRMSRGMAPPAPEFNASAAHDSYQTVEEDISYGQASRMVQKSLARSKAKKF